MVLFPDIIDLYQFFFFLVSCNMFSSYSLFSPILFRSTPSPTCSTLLWVLTLKKKKHIKANLCYQISLYVQSFTGAQLTYQELHSQKKLTLLRQLTIVNSNFYDWDGTSSPTPIVTMRMSKRIVNPCIDLVWL